MLRGRWSDGELWQSEDRHARSPSHTASPCNTLHHRATPCIAMQRPCCIPPLTQTSSPPTVAHAARPHASFCITFAFSPHRSIPSSSVSIARSVANTASHSCRFVEIRGPHSPLHPCRSVQIRGESAPSQHACPTPYCFFPPTIASFDPLLSA